MFCVFLKRKKNGVACFFISFLFFSPFLSSTTFGGVHFWMLHSAGKHSSRLFLLYDYMMAGWLLCIPWSFPLTFLWGCEPVGCTRRWFFLTFFVFVGHVGLAGGFLGFFVFGACFLRRSRNGDGRDYVIRECFHGIWL